MAIGLRFGIDFCEEHDCPMVSKLTHGGGDGATPPPLRVEKIFFLIIFIVFIIAL